MSMYTHGRAEPVNGYPTAATSTGGQPGVVNTTGPTAGHYDATHPTVIDMRQDSHNVSNSGDAGVVPAERSAHFEVMDNVSPASSTAGPVPLAEQPIPCEFRKPTSCLSKPVQASYTSNVSTLELTQAIDLHRLERLVRRSRASPSLLCRIPRHPDPRLVGRRYTSSSRRLSQSAK